MLKSVPLSAMPKSASAASITVSAVHPVTGVPLQPGFSVIRQRGNDSPIVVDDSATLAELKAHFAGSDSQANVKIAGIVR